MARAVIDVLRLSTGYLAQHGSPSARLDAELLCARAWGMQRLDLYLQHDRPLRDEELAAARALMRRRAAGEPVAYILEEREFYTRTFRVTPAVLIPRPETETLIDAALQFIRNRQDERIVVADLGTGSGCIAATLAAELPDVRVIASDSSAEALAVARSNAALIGVADRISFLESDWGAQLRSPVDLLVSNPPYVTSEELAAADRGVRDFEPSAALDAGADGLDAYRALIASLNGVLRRPAGVILEVDPRRAAAVQSLLLRVFPDAAVTTHRDLAGHERVVEARLP